MKRKEKMHIDMRKRLALAALGAFALSGALAATVTADYAIAVPDPVPGDIPEFLARAAKELAHDIREATGLNLPVVTARDVKPSGRYIFVGEGFAARAGLLPKDRPLTGMDNVVAEKGGSVYLFGHDRTRYSDGRKPRYWIYCLLPSAKAVCSFMERELGVAFLAPGREGRDVRKCAALTVPDGLYRRETLGQDAAVAADTEMMFDLASGVFGRGLVWTHGGHLYHVAVPMAKYAKEHPEYFPLHGDARDKSNPNNALCISNPDVERLIVECIVRQMDEGAEAVELGQNDGTGWCECEKCRDFAGTAPDDWSEKFWIFHRRIAEQVWKAHPDRTVVITSYGPTSVPPKTFRAFPPNVMVEVMGFNERRRRQWAKYEVPRGFANYIYFWGDYPQPGFTCKTSIAFLAREARLYRASGLRFVFRCGYGELFGTEGPSYYVFNRLMQDPEADENAAFDEYVSRAYGPAAKAMEGFHRQQDRRVRSFDRLRWGFATRDDSGEEKTLPEHPAEMLAMLYPPDVLAKLEKSLAEAERTPDLTGKQKARIRLVRLEFDYLKLTVTAIHLYHAYRLVPSVESFRPIVTALEARNAFIDSLYDEKGRMRSVPGVFRPPFRNASKAMLLTNGRLSARLSAPFAWDGRSMLEKGVLPGMSTAVCRVARAEGTLAFGDFESGAWAKAAWNGLNGIQLEKIRTETRFKLLADDANLYVAVRSSLPPDRTYEPTGHDSSCYRRDNLDLVIDPTAAAERLYHFIWGPVQDSCLEEARGLVSDPLDPLFGSFDGSWNGKWSYRTARRGDTWLSLATIPFETLGVGRPKPGEKWRMNLGRVAEPDGARGNVEYSKLELSLWSPNFENLAFFNPEAMGTLVFE